MKTQFGLKYFIVIALLANMVSSWAYAQFVPPVGNGPDKAADQAIVPLEPKAVTDMKKAMENAKEKMAAFEVTANSDYDFALMLRMYRQAALDMAKAELAYGKDPAMRSMAGKLIPAQKKELEQLDQWLAKFHRFD